MLKHPGLQAKQGQGVSVSVKGISNKQDGDKLPESILHVVLIGDCCSTPRHEQPPGSPAEDRIRFMATALLLDPCSVFVIHVRIAQHAVGVFLLVTLLTAAFLAIRLPPGLILVDSTKFVTASTSWRHRSLLEAYLCVRHWGRGVGLQNKYVSSMHTTVCIAQVSALAPSFDAYAQRGTVHESTYSSSYQMMALRKKNFGHPACSRRCMQGLTMMVIGGWFHVQVQS